MRLTVSHIAARPELGLTLLCAKQTAELTPVDWAHSIDRVDSEKWIGEGTLVLTSGYQMPSEDDEEALQRQLYALKDAGASALAIDTGGRWEKVPDCIVSFGESMSFPILAVAPDTPFSTVVRAVAEDVMAARANRISNLAAQQSNFARTLLRSGLGEVVKQVADYLEAVVVVVDNFGGVTAASAEGQTLKKAVSSPPYSPKVTKSDVFGQGVRMIQPLTGPRSAQGAVIVDAKRFFDDSDRLLVSYIAALVSLYHYRTLAVQGVEERLRRQAMGSIMAGRVPEKDTLHLFNLTSETTVTAICLSGARLDYAELAEELLGLGAHFLMSSDSSSTDGAAKFYVLHDGASDIYRVLWRRLSVRHTHLKIGAGEPMPLKNGSLSVKQAEVALPKEGSRARIRAISELPAHEVIFGVMADSAALEVLTGGAYRKLAEFDEKHNDHLLPAAKAYLEANGRFEKMAKALNIHRQTARTRAHRIEEVLHTSLEDPDVRVELWLAFRTAAWSPRQ